MLNMVKVLELTLSGGVCLLTGERIGPDTGTLAGYASFEQLEAAYERQLDHFIDLTIRACDTVDRAHAELLPSPFLSSVIDDCVDQGADVTAGGATYNLSGIQAIQVANVADSLAAIKQCVYDERSVSASRLMDALRSDFEGHEPLRQRLLNRVPKYGNDVEWVDQLAPGGPSRSPTNCVLTATPAAGLIMPVSTPSRRMSRWARMWAPRRTAGNPGRLSPTAACLRCRAEMRAGLRLCSSRFPVSIAGGAATAPCST